MKIIIVANVEKVSEIRKTKKGTAFADVVLGTLPPLGGHYKTHRVKAFGTLAEYCVLNLRKGARVYGEGELKDGVITAQILKPLAETATPRF